MASTTLLADLKTPLPRQFTFKDPGKIRELARRDTLNNSGEVHYGAAVLLGSYVQRRQVSRDETDNIFGQLREARRRYVFDRMRTRSW
jgi:hypothetical protein